MGEGTGAQFDGKKTSLSTFIEAPKNSQGEWVKFNKGSDPQLLADSFKGYENNFWASVSTDRKLSESDHYVYFSPDIEGKLKIPRLAMSIYDGKILDDPEGIVIDETIDLDNLNIFEEKLKEFPGNDLYKETISDMKKIVEIKDKSKENIELSKDELRFLYEIKGKIKVFLYKFNDFPLVDDIIRTRNIRHDLHTCTGINESDISVSVNESEKSGKIHFGVLDKSSFGKVEDSILPEIILGSYYHRDSRSISDYQFSNIVRGEFRMKNLTEATNITLPKEIDQTCDLSKLESVKNVTFPESVGADLRLNSLKSSPDTILPKTIGNNLFLGKLESVKNITLPESVGKNIYLYSLKSIEGLDKMPTCGGTVFLNDLDIESVNILKTKYPNLKIERWHNLSPYPASKSAQNQ